MNRPLINYELAYLTVPLLMAGAIFGVTLNKFLPNILIFALLLFILIRMVGTTKAAYNRVKIMDEKLKLLLEKDPNNHDTEV